MKTSIEWIKKEKIKNKKEINMENREKMEKMEKRWMKWNKNGKNRGKMEIK
jgi:hypothetical protein